MHRQNLDQLKQFDSLALSSLTDELANSYHIAKRILDLILSIFLFMLLSPFMLLISILIIMDSHGPVIFSQERIGAKRIKRDGFSYWQQNPFTCYKFRTMIHDANPTIHQDYVEAFVKGSVESSGSDELNFKINKDPRVTRIGRVLRRTSLDELPQLINILRGEMSLVGPRPDVPYAVKHYQTWHCERLAALPGLTGLWQTKGRSNVSFDNMARFDIEYIHNQSLLLDVKILILTIPAVLTGKGAV